MEQQLRVPSLTSSSRMASSPLNALMARKKLVRVRMAELRRQKTSIDRDAFVKHGEKMATSVRVKELRTKHDQLDAQKKSNAAVSRHLERKLDALKERERRVSAKRQSLRDALKAMQKRREHADHDLFECANQQVDKALEHLRFALNKIGLRASDKTLGAESDEKTGKQQELTELRTKRGKMAEICGELGKSVQNSKSEKIGLKRQMEELGERAKVMELRLQSRRQKLYFGGRKVGKKV